MAHEYDVNERAIVIANQALAACVTPDGFVAGPHHFVDLWARDSLFATFGATSPKFERESLKTLESFLRAVRSDGLVPFLIRRSRLTLGKYFGYHEYFLHPVAQFRSSQSGGTVLDGGLMTIIAARNYIEQSKDRRFLERHQDTFWRILSWYTNRFKSTLLSEWFQCEWNDAVLKVGSTLYTNVLYWKALRDGAWLMEKMRQTAHAQVLKVKEQYIKNRLIQTFWNGTYLSDWYDYRRQDYLAVFPNALAVYWGLVDRQKAHSIARFALIHCFGQGHMKSVYPKYPFWRIPITNHMIGLADYQNGCIWLQPTIVFALALFALGEKKRAHNLLTRVAHVIVASDGVYEVYESTGAPLFRRFYRAEGPFAWSAGLFLWARGIVRP